MTKDKISVWLMTLAAVFMLLTACASRSGASQSQPEATGQQGDKLQVFFIDVGKGDAALIGLPGEHWVMIDTGPIEGFPEIGRTLMNQGVTRLDAVFISHGHKDHIGGLNSVLKIAKSSRVYTIPDCLDDKEISDAKKDFDIEVNTLTAGRSVQIGDAVFKILGPVNDYDDENNNSMVLMFEYKDTRILFTADQLSAAENDLLKSGQDLKADVLKVAYHGGGESTSGEFAMAVSPRFAVIPTDATRLPDKSTLEALSKTGARAFVLGDTGTLVFDGTNITPVFAPKNGAPKVSVSEKDVTAEYVTITNHTAQTIDLTGWCLYSINDADTYFYPAGTVLPPHGSLTVYSGKAAESATDGLIWTQKKIWSNKKEDICELFDSYGRLVGSR